MVYTAVPEKYVNGGFVIILDFNHIVFLDFIKSFCLLSQRKPLSNYGKGVCTKYGHRIERQSRPLRHGQSIGNGRDLRNSSFSVLRPVEWSATEGLARRVLWVSARQS